MARARLSASIADNRLAQSKLRDRGLAAREGMSDEEQEAASDKISAAVVQARWFRRCERIGCYLPMAGEVDTWSIIARAWRMKKRIFAPIIEKNHTMSFRALSADSDLVENRYGLLEPLDEDSIRPRDLDVVITPLVAFDDAGNRIGMGGGYFDRTFSFLKHRRIHIHPKLIGLAFSCQQVEKIPANPWDIRVFSVVSELSQG